MATASGLRELADILESIGKAQNVLAAADSAYRANKDDDNARKRYKDAARDLTLKRDRYRRSGLRVTANEPGSVTVQNAIARQSARVVAQRVGE
jgi:hypothetical protein